MSRTAKRHHLVPEMDRAEELHYFFFIGRKCNGNEQCKWWPKSAGVTGEKEVCMDWWCGRELYRGHIAGAKFLYRDVCNSEVGHVPALHGENPLSLVESSDSGIPWMPWWRLYQGSCTAEPDVERSKEAKEVAREGLPPLSKKDSRKLGIVWTTPRGRPPTQRFPAPMAYSMQSLIKICPYITWGWVFQCYNWSENWQRRFFRTAAEMVL